MHDAQIGHWYDTWMEPRFMLEPRIKGKIVITNWLMVLLKLNFPSSNGRFYFSGARLRAQLSASQPCAAQSDGQNESHDAYMHAIPKLATSILWLVHRNSGCGSKPWSNGEAHASSKLPLQNPSLQGRAPQKDTTMPQSGHAFQTSRPLPRILREVIKGVLGRAGMGIKMYQAQGPRVHSRLSGERKGWKYGPTARCHFSNHEDIQADMAIMWFLGDVCVIGTWPNTNR